MGVENNKEKELKEDKEVGKRGVLLLGLIASAVAPFASEVVKPSFKKLFGGGRRIRRQ